MPDLSRPFVSRRRFLGAGTAGTAAAVLLGTGWWDAAVAAPPLPAYPFQLGVGSGDPTHDGVVLWTRLTQELLAEDGRGGMPRRTIPVNWQVATDEGFRDVVRAGVAFATPELGHSVHPEVTGLQPGRHYWYRFRVGPHLSPVGRTRTAPAPGTMAASLTFAFGSCQSYHGGLYTAYQRMVEEPELDLVIHLGDYIYEESYGYTDDHDGNRLPDHVLGETVDLATYRLQYSVYKSDRHLQAAHAYAPWLCTFDDHEVDDGWMNDRPKDGTREAFLTRRAAAFQAMYENLPLRHTQMPAGPDILAHRRIRYGTLADFTMLDTRSYRTTRVGREDPDASMLGGAQAQWLVDGFASSEARWQIIGNQVVLAQADRNDDPDVESWFADSWDAYTVERDRVLTAARERDVDNLVVVTGDRHCNYMMDLKADFDDPDSAVVGSEIVGTSLSSNGDGADMVENGEKLLRANPHLKFFNNQRGYSRVTVTPDRLTQDFRVLPYVKRPDAPIQTRASFVIENGVPGAQPA